MRAPARIRRWLAPPRFDDPAASRQAAILHAVVVFILATFAVLLVLTPLQPATTPLSVGLFYGPIAALHLATLVLLRRGHIRRAARLYVGALFALVTAVVACFGGMAAPTGGYIVLTVVAGFVLGGRAGHAVVAASVLAAGLFVQAENAGLLPEPMIRLGPVDAWIGLTANLVMVAFLVQLGLGRLRGATERAERGEHALRASVETLRATQRVNEARARQGTALARLAQEVLQMRDVGVACRRAVTLVAETLDAGHVALLERDLVGRVSPRCQRTRDAGWPDPVPAAALEPLADVLGGLCGATGHGEGEAHPPLEVAGRRLEAAVASGIPGRERVHGALVVGEFAAGPPAAEDVAFIETVAGLLGAVIEHERAEDRLRHAQKMDVVGQLAGGVAHDFNNLLTSILSSAELAERSLPPDRPERALLAEVRAAGELAALLTRQLLAFSRRQMLRPERLRVDEVVARMEALLKRLIGDAVEIRATLGAGDAAIECDRGNLEQVVLNLALNARDATGRAGTVRIETRTERLDEVPPDLLLAPGLYAVLSVRDDGRGMSEDLRRHIFEPFFTTKEASQGTGLGLFTVHGIVAAARGDVRVRSAPGRGSCFEVFLPLAPAVRAAPAPPRPPTPAPARSGTLLLVEDDARVRHTAHRILAEAGFTIVEAADGEEALARFDAGLEPVLVVTDLVMPRLGGIALAAALVERGYEGPLLLMSGYAPDAIDLGRVPSERVALAPKPFSPSELLERVDALLAEHAAAKPLAARSLPG